MYMEPSYDTRARRDTDPATKSDVDLCIQSFYPPFFVLHTRYPLCNRRRALGQVMALYIDGFYINIEPSKGS